MVRSMFAGVAGLRTHQSKLDVIGNNIANVNTWGFKSLSANFMDSLYTNNTNSTGGNVEVQGGLGGINASQVGYGVQMSSISRDFSKSTPYATGRELDIMIDGTGFLIVGTSKGGLTTGSVISTANGADIAGAGIQLSRVGILNVDNQGFLLDNQGNYIYGYVPDATVDRTEVPEPDPNNPDDPNLLGNPTLNMDRIAPIRIPVKTAGTAGAGNESTDVLYELQNYKIMSDGTVIGYTKDTEKQVTLGKIALANVQNVNGLESTSGYYYQVGENAGTCTANQSNGILGKFLSSYLEMPNVDLAKEFSEMITTQRGYQANTKVITVTDEMLQELVNMKR